MILRAARDRLKKMKAFAKDRSGLSAVELAFVIPIAVSLTFNGIEFTRYILMHQKAERASMTVADLVSQGEVLTPVDLTNIFRAGSFIAEPFDFDADGRMIVSSVVGTQSGPVVEWQRAFGQNPNSSSLGGQGGAATLPAGFVVPQGDSVVMAEVYFDYTPLYPGNPLLGAIVGENTVYTYALFRPRYTVKVRLGS